MSVCSPNLAKSGSDPTSLAKTKASKDLKVGPMATNRQPGHLERRLF